jgi:hypothetical protein
LSLIQEELQEMTWRPKRLPESIVRSGPHKGQIGLTYARSPRSKMRQGQITKEDRRRYRNHVIRKEVWKGSWNKIQLY